MKRALFLSLILLFSFLVTTMVFAATDNIEDPLAPLSTESVTGINYNEFDEPDIPQSPPDEEILYKLPQTGGIPAETFYIAGGICILSAILLLTRKSKSTVSNDHIVKSINKKP